MTGEKYTMQVELDTRRVPQQYEEMMRRLAMIQRRYKHITNPTIGMRGGGRGSAVERALGNSVTRTGGSNRFAFTQTSANIRQSIRDTLASASRTSLDGADAAAMDMLTQKLRKVFGATRTAKTRAEVSKLKAEYRDTTRQINKMVRAQEALNKKLSLGADAGAKFTSSLKRAGLQFASIYAIGHGASVVFQIGREMDSLRAALLGASDGAADADRNFKFLTENSQKYGKDITTMVRGFNKIGAGAKAMGMDVKEAREIFLGATEAATAYGLSTARTELVMQAIGQMMS